LLERHREGEQQINLIEKNLRLRTEKRAIEWFSKKDADGEKKNYLPGKGGTYGGG